MRSSRIRALDRGCRRFHVAKLVALAAGALCACGAEDARRTVDAVRSTPPAAATRLAAATGAVAFVQVAAATPQTAQTSVPVKFAAAQAAGDLNVVVVGWNDTTASVTAVTDTSGNVYARAVGPTAVPGTLSQSIYFAKNIAAAAAGANTVTVTFNPAAQYADVRILEYGGLDATSPVDVTAAATGTGTLTDSGPASTTNANDLLFAANTVTTSTTGAGAGFTSRIVTIPDGDIAEDQVVTAQGSYRATAPISSGTWVMQMVAFRAAGAAPPDTQAPTAPTSLVATAASSSQVSLTWAASTDNIGVTGYLVERCQGAGCASFAQIATTTTTSTVDGGLLASTSYSYRVRATDAAGNLSGYSNTATAVTTSATSATSVLTQRYDNARSGANTAEATLTPANVNASTFGKLFSLTVDGAVYAQPLYVPGVATASGTHNLLLVATEHDSVFAFDADAPGTPVWTANLASTAYGAASGATPVPSSDVSCADLTPEIGITGTPAIDAGSGTLYVVAKTKEGTGYVQRLHALDVATGQSKGRTAIQPTIAGSGSGAVGGQLTFDPRMQLQRTGLLLQGGLVTFGFGSHCDNPIFHGWVMAFDASTLALSAAWSPTPNGGQGGVWAGGTGLAADASGNAYVSTGNGTFDPTTGGYGDSVVKLALSTLSPTSYFTPHDQANLDTKDLDLGSGGAVLLPDQPGSHPHLLVVAGKGGTVYLVDRDVLGGFSSATDLSVQSIPGALGPGGFFGAAAYWNGSVYFQAEADTLKAFALTNGTLSTTPKQSPSTAGFPGAAAAVSSSGTSNGVVWTIDASAYKTGGPAVLHAYDPVASATSLPELYSSAQNATRDSAGPAVKFAVPTVVNGKVYVAASGEVDVYGLLSGAPPPPPPPPPSTTATPTFSPTPKSYSPGLQVTISDATAGAVIYYTTNGSTPTTSSTRYTGPIVLNTTTTINAIAVAPGFAQSAVATAKYTIRKR